MDNAAAVHIGQSGPQLFDNACGTGKAERAFVQSGSEGLAVEERHGQAGFARRANPGIQNGDYAGMLDRSQGGHFVREAIANPAILFGVPVENFDSQACIAVAKIARFIDYRKSAARDDAAETVASEKSFAGVIRSGGLRGGRASRGGEAKTATQQKCRFLDAKSDAIEARSETNNQDQCNGSAKKSYRPAPTRR